MTKWNYKTFAFVEINGAALEAKMNELGQDGWEYCGASAFQVEAGMLYCYLFKRPEPLVQIARTIV